MKRRNADCGKLRRLPKRSKITEGFYGSTFLYLKFLMVWALVLMADFILEFRFEYLWPFWLLVRSVYDSFKYQGLAFSVFFVCIAVTSDVICYLFIPVQWLFFAASTYVWVQYVWHTERGICLPTVSLWLLFVYIEASVRLREFKSLPFNLDLCRPFAAHCIGYPVVTLGFGFKSYISYKMRLRKQKEVQRQNDYYINLIQKALPPELQSQYIEKQKALPSKSEEDVISNGVAGGKKSGRHDDEKEIKRPNKVVDENEDDSIEFIEQSLPKNSSKADVNNFDEIADNISNDQQSKFRSSNSIGKTQVSKLNTSKESNKKGKNYNKEAPPATFSNNKDEVILRLESDIKKLKTDLQTSRNCEQELRTQIGSFMGGEKSMRSELYQLQEDNESLQNKLHNLVTSRQQDKQSILLLEKKLNEERKGRAGIELQLNSERKAKKAEEAAAARAVAMAAAARGECTESCKARQKNIENDIKLLKQNLKVREEQFRQLEFENQSLHQYKEAQTETDVLMSALSAMQDKNTHLENSLSAETRIKLDLFSALGEAKRQIEILKNLVAEKDKEIADLKSKVTEAMAINMMPSSTTVNGCGMETTSTSPLYSSNYKKENSMVIKSNLNPHATDYTPKTTSI
ncbi:macoilin-like [Ylistrum balloti]|uniref:macoilin-like n=1 Tax=Ylistrum balloti TaxID=509963 RepID=UPI002905B038|nr:macoilin-like [Ylistrum balloti]